MADYEGGTAFVQFTGSFKGMVEAATAEAVRDGKAFIAAFNRELEKGSAGLDLGPGAATSAKDGAEAGSKYADGFKARVKAAGAAKIKVDADTTAASAKLAALDKQAKDTANSSRTSLLGVLAAIAPATLPIAATAGGALAGLIPTVATLGLGIKGITSEMKDGSLAGTQYARDLASIKSEGQQLEHLAAGGLLAGIDKGLQSSHGLFGEINADVSLMSGEIGQIVGDAGPALLKVFAEANPLFRTFGRVLVDGAENLESWAESSDGIEHFVAYVQAELPDVLTLGGELVTTLGNLAEGAAPFGGALLHDMDAFFGAVDKIPVGVLQAAVPAVVSLYAAFLAYKGTTAIVNGYNAAVGKLGPTFKRATASSSVWAARSEADNLAVSSSTAAEAAATAASRAAEAEAAAEAATEEAASAEARGAADVALTRLIAENAIEQAAAYQAEARAAADAATSAATSASAAADASATASATTALGFSSVLGPAAALIAGGTLLATTLGHTGKSAQDAAQQINSLTQAIEDDNGAIGKNTRQNVANALEQAGAAAAARELHLTLGDITDAALHVPGAMDKVNAAMRQYGGIAGGVAAKNPQLVAGLADSAHGMRSNEQAAVTLSLALSGQTSNVKQAVSAAKDMATVQDQAASSTDSFTAALQKAEAAVLALGQTELAQAQSEDAFKEGLLGITHAVHENGTSLSQNTKGGLANRDMLLQLLQQANAVAQAQQKNGKSVQGVTHDLIANVQQLEQTATKAGLSKDAVQKLVAQMKLTPKDIRSTFRTNAGVVLGEVKTIEARLKAMTEQDYRINMTTVLHGGVANLGNGIKAKATGGKITGPGTGTSDSILAALSNGEFVSTADATARNQAALEAGNRGATLLALPGFRDGGLASLSDAVLAATGDGGPPVSGAVEERMTL